MRIDREWAMPNKWTFTIGVIKQLVQEEMADFAPWVDPFGGMHSPAHISNDMNPQMPTQYHMDSLDFLKLMKETYGTEYFVGGIFDPPFSVRQVKECYEGLGLKTPPEQTKSSYLTKCKDALAPLVELYGKVISFGWNSAGMGKNRGFTIKRILLVPHGGPHNDTIVTVETKVRTVKNLI